MKILPLSFLPNQESFAFIGILHDGNRISCSVGVDESGMHYVVGAKFSELKGWVRA